MKNFRYSTKESNEKFFLESLEDNGGFLAKEAKLILNECQFNSLEKNDYLLKKGSLSRSVFFVINGFLSRHIIDNDSEIVVCDLFVEKEWIISYENIILNQPSMCYIQALSDCALFELPFKSVQKLFSTSRTFYQLIKILGESNAFFNPSIKINTPIEKYTYLLNNHPKYLQNFTQKMVASYLKISPETLSRVKRKVLKQANNL